MNDSSLLKTMAEAQQFTLPEYDRWIEFAHLIKTGMRFARRRCCVGSGRFKREKCENRCYRPYSEDGLSSGIVT
ncbi:MAG: hypothetical protein K8L99_10315 [Anaerolineae bacterium]|nr:hypothetical protein [Anaerolineae bacterium]